MRLEYELTPEEFRRAPVVDRRATFSLLRVAQNGELLVLLLTLIAATGWLVDRSRPWALKLVVLESVSALATMGTMFFTRFFPMWTLEFLAERPSLRMVVDESGVTARTRKQTITHHWAQLKHIRQEAGDIVFEFLSGERRLVPSRVFASESERLAFMEFVHANVELPEAVVPDKTPSVAGPAPLRPWHWIDSAGVEWKLSYPLDTVAEAVPLRWPQNITEPPRVMWLYEERQTNLVPDDIDGADYLLARDPTPNPPWSGVESLSPRALSDWFEATRQKD